ncbi:hypothetical protein C2S53_019369 [Perilla frutescens var. hirtella]|uniref:Transposase Tnp1/En/Spm-like domain-containing protein n=1 Tax=Perilla frutescens var. hirtella TaxID=608512 RepID=A0AAD4PDG9_PERFH|nr:hypothetical protein C2S53_019369 [Perilla frutescens var. hirtella]
MAPRTRRSSVRRKLNHGLRDEEEIEEYEQQSEQLVTPRTRRTPINQIEKHGGQQESVQPMRPQISRVQVVTPKTRRATASQIKEHTQNESLQPQIIQQTSRIQVVTPKTNRATTNQMKKRTQKEPVRPQMSQQASRIQVVTPRTRRAAENQMKEHTQKESVQPQMSQQASRIQVLTPRTRRATENQMKEHTQNENVQPQINDEASEEQGLTKQSRGPTHLPDLWTRNLNEGCILVNFNKKDWRKVPKARKDELIRMVKERFDVPNGTEHWILLSIGKKRRHWRSRVKSGCFSSISSIESQAHNRPIREMSDKNKDHRRCSVMQQTTGKLSFAEVEEEFGRSPSRVEMFDACFTDLNGDPSCAEVAAALGEMKEVQSKLPPGSRDSIGPSDSFAKVMGKDPHGRVRMVGLGVNPSDITGGIPSRSACYRMVLKNQVAMTRMEEKVDAATKLIANLQEKMQQNANNVSTARRPASPGQSSNSINLEHTFQVGDTVLLKSLFDSRKIVAKGYVRSIDPNQDVGGKRLGLNWCEVQISIPIEWDEDLIRPYSNLSTIGTCVAWPRHLVTNVDDQE